MDKPRRLLPKQQAFVEHYAACGNATEAARRAGYKEPNKQGPKNLVNVGIKAALSELADTVSSDRIADAKERQEYWTALMRGEVKGDPKMLKIGLKASELLGRAKADFVAESPTTTTNNLWITPDTLRTIREVVYGLSKT